MKHVSTHTSSFVEASEIMVDDWFEIGGILARAIDVSSEDIYIYVTVDMEFIKNSHHSILRFPKGKVVEIYNQKYPPTE